MDTAEVVRVLAGMEELRQSGPVQFLAAAGLPWVDFVFAMADARGNYAADSTPPTTINVVELVCSQFEAASWYEALARRIASALHCQI